MRHRRVYRFRLLSRSRHVVVHSAEHVAEGVDTDGWREGHVADVMRVMGAWSAFQRFPNHRLKVFDGGHAAFVKDPDRFEKSLRRFLEENVR
jgi:hypothetical protein